MTAWQTAGRQGKLHFPYAALRQLSQSELAGSEHLYASYSLPASLKKTSGSTAGHRKERLKQSHLSIPNMIRAPTFRRSTQRQEPHPCTTEYRRAAELTQRGDSRLYQRAVFYAAATIR
ncbi:hypothetical protein GN277_27440 [Lachnospiraceae bacterium WCA-9-b2]|uniref:Uncharacterized protein n=1 Tax=Sporofaciens musculi TaxID=2681861 RepID=A0A7X3SLV6_9FIRM|nr:hypothetical protein [Sporofaciens musculi]MXP78927.1 hypothetical protein [Sporofaciens musculi]